MFVEAAKWFGTFMQLSGALAVACNLGYNKVAFGVMLVGSVIWLSYAVSIHDLPLIVLNCFYCAINLWGVWRHL